MRIKKYIKQYLNVNKIAGMLRFIPDEKYLKIRFRLRVGYRLNLKDPKGFNEKLQWLKLHDRRDIYHTLVDKEMVKAYVAEKIGVEYIIPTIKVWNHVEEINYDELPQSFVLKCTHDSGGVVVCSEKAALDFTKVKKIIRRSFDCNFYWIGREWPYKDLTPHIIAEQYIGDGSDLIDYKFMCFNGKVKSVFTCSNRSKENGTLYVTFFDRDWKRLPFERHYPASPTEIAKPENYGKMLEFAERLSSGYPFMRVDFYNTKGKIYFGELTLYPGDGFEEFNPREWDYTFGSWLDIPVKVRDEYEK